MVQARRQMKYSASSRNEIPTGPQQSLEKNNHIQDLFVRNSINTDYMQTYRDKLILALTKSAEREEAGEHLLWGSFF